MIQLTRKEDNGIQTTGVLKVFDSSGVIFECKTLELPYLNNQKNISCIPMGEYTMRKRWSWKFKKMLYEIEGVSNRSAILIHSGNYYTDIRGCVLVGDSFQDINSDGYMDILNSRNTLKELHSYLNTVENISVVVITKS